MILILVIPVIVLFWAFLRFGRDELRQYKEALGLEKANLAYASDYQKLRNMILPTRKSVFSRTEPVIWLYRKNGVELFLAANWKGDTRIWFQPKSVLQGVHIVLDGTLNDSVRSNLVIKKLPEQLVQLEGDFSRHFKLYCRPNQQILALQIIAPDIMTYLLDYLLQADIEIIDDQVALVARGAAKSAGKLQASLEAASVLDRLVKAATKVTRVD